MSGDMNQATPPIDLRQVLYFVTIVDELSFTRAANRLHISTPALSQQIKALERHLGVQLLIRDTHRVRVTPAGEVFAQAGRRLLDEGESTVVQTREAAGRMAGSLNLASLHEAESVFEPFLTDFHAAHPEIRLAVTTMRQAELVAAVRSRTADAALTWSFLLERGGDTQGLRWERVASVEVVALFHAGSNLAALDKVPRGERLRETPVVVFERGYSPLTFDYVMEELFGSECGEPPVREVPVTVRAQETMVRHVVGGSFAPLSRPVAEMLRGSLEIRPFDPPWVLDGCVVWQNVGTSTAVMALLAAAASVPSSPDRVANPHGSRAIG